LRQGGRQPNRCCIGQACIQAGPEPFARPATHARCRFR
jgi:hypothetical protein